MAERDKEVAVGRDVDEREPAICQHASLNWCSNVGIPTWDASGA